MNEWRIGRWLRLAGAEKAGLPLAGLGEGAGGRSCRLAGSHDRLLALVAISGHLFGWRDVVGAPAGCAHLLELVLLLLLRAARLQENIKGSVLLAG